MAETEHAEHELAAAKRLAEKINTLFSTVHPPDRKPYSSDEVANWLAETSDQGPTISANYLRYLRRAEKMNPGVQQLHAIARFFRIDTAYLLTDDEDTQRKHEQLLQLGILRNAKVHGIATRAAAANPRIQDWLYNLVTTMPTETDDDTDTGA